MAGPPDNPAESVVKFMNTKNNRRAQETGERIIRAVHRAMVQEKKPLEKITVREVCEAAGINRSTFYAHYLDVYDVVEQVEKTMARSLTQSFTAQLEENAPLEECFESLFAFIREYQDFYRLYLNQTNKTGAIGVAWELLENRTRGLSYRDFGMLSQREMTYEGHFFLFGLTAMVRQWVNDGCPESPRQMVGILIRLFQPQRGLLQ